MHLMPCMPVPAREREREVSGNRHDAVRDEAAEMRRRRS